MRAISRRFALAIILGIIFFEKRKKKKKADMPGERRIAVIIVTKRAVAN